MTAKELVIDFDKLITEADWQLKARGFREIMEYEYELSGLRLDLTTWIEDKVFSLRLIVHTKPHQATLRSFQELDTLLGFLDLKRYQPDKIQEEFESIFYPELYKIKNKIFITNGETKELLVAREIISELNKDNRYTIR